MIGIPHQSRVWQCRLWRMGCTPAVASEATLQQVAAAAAAHRRTGHISAAAAAVAAEEGKERTRGKRIAAQRAPEFHLNKITLSSGAKRPTSLISKTT